MNAELELYTPKEVANILKVSVDSVIRKFEKVPGVIDLGTDETRFKRRYRVLRIPRSSLQKFLIDNRVR